jgi:hypothetical protein
MSHRRKRESSKVNLILSAVFHSLLVLAVFYFAARQGVMGDKMKSLVATLEQQKPKETPKPPKEEPKPEPTKQVEQPKTVAAPTPVPQVQTAAAPPVEAPPSGRSSHDRRFLFRRRRQGGGGGFGSEIDVQR